LMEYYAAIKKWKQPECPCSVLHPHTGILLSHEQAEALTHATMRRDLEDTVVSERSRHTRPHRV
jgi:hypothetical protein